MDKTSTQNKLLYIPMDVYKNKKEVRKIEFLVNWKRKEIKHGGLRGRKNDYQSNVLHGLQFRKKKKI